MKTPKSKSTPNSLAIFEHQDFGKIRTVTIDGDPWFVAKDVATALGYKNSPDALKKHVDTEDRRVLQKSQNVISENLIKIAVKPCRCGFLWLCKLMKIPCLTLF